MLSDFKNFLNNRAFLSTVIFAFLLFAAESRAFNLGFSELGRLFYDAAWGELMLFASLSLAAFLIAVFFIWSAFVSGYDYKVIYFVCFLLAVSTEYGYQSAVGRFSLPSDLGNAFFATDLNTKWHAVTAYFNPRALISCLVFGAVVFLTKPKYKNGWKLLCLNVIFFISFFSLNVKFSDQKIVTLALTAYYKNLVEGVWYFAEDASFTSPRVEPTFFSKEKPRNNVVFIVDESVRADHLGLNGYPRDTTPFLVELSKKGLIKNWGAAVSGTTESVSSNKLLLTGLNKLPDPDFEVNKITSIFQYARAMGYKTFYFDGQMECCWNGTRFDVADFGTKVTLYDYKSRFKYDIDGEIARMVNELVKDTTGNFIWINKRGTHFPYETNYPADRTLWSPTDRTAVPGETGDPDQPLINNYDNAIKYNSELFFTNLFPEGVPRQTIYVYTSDHGQTLINGKVSHTGSTKNEALVPLFIIAQPELLPPEVDTAFKASHANLFATLLDAMQYPENEREYNYSLSLFKAKKEDSAPRRYFSGLLTGSPNGEVLPYDE